MMDGILKFAVIGGDMRISKLAELLADDGHIVNIFALPKTYTGSGVRPVSTLHAAVSGANCVVLPLPACGENGRLNAPLIEDSYAPEDVFCHLKEGQIVVGGMIKPALRELSEVYGVLLYDYFEREELAVSNAVPTVEGAIQLALEEMPITLHNARCLVLGYGRVGKLLAHRLRGLGANVTVAARSCADLSWIKAFGYGTLNSEALDGSLAGYDLILNTVPHRIITEARLAQIDPGCLCIDLASKPGGIDFAAASKLGVRAIWALSLPGKVAPATAGLIIKETIYNILNESGSKAYGKN